MTDTPGTESQPYVTTYEIKSNHPQRDSASMAEDIDESLPDLITFLKDEKGYGNVTVSMTERGTLPIDPSTLVIAIHVVGPLIAKGIATGVGSKIGADIYEWLKKRLKNASVHATQGHE